MNRERVFSDASFHAGWAGIAVTGSLGELSRRIASRSSIEAELAAVMLAMELALFADVELVTFHSDCLGAVEWWHSPRANSPRRSRRRLGLCRSAIGGVLQARPGWKLVHTGGVEGAHELARRALRGEAR